VLATSAAWLALWRPLLWLRLAAAAGATLLCLAALPVVAERLMQQVELAPAALPDAAAAQAIVVLGGGVQRGDGAEVPDTLNAWSLQRVYFAAQAYRQLALPVAVTGGQTRGAGTSEARLMREVLERDFAVPVTWTDDRSETTFENARYTAALLKPQGITAVVVVTHAWHMRRAMWSFERVGLHAVAWPAPRTHAGGDQAADYLPRAGALFASYRALHEAVGLTYYRLRY